MESEATNLIVKNVKIYKTIFVETYIRKEWLWLLKECHNHYQEDKKEFICVYYHCKKNSKMIINEHQKKGCDKVMDFERNPFKFKLYPPLRNTTKGVYIAKGQNILEYKAKACIVEAKE